MCNNVGSYINLKILLHLLKILLSNYCNISHDMYFIFWFMLFLCYLSQIIFIFLKYCFFSLILCLT